MKHIFVGAIILAFNEKFSSQQYSKLSKKTNLLKIPLLFCKKKKKKKKKY
jgi:hypothetical protein